MCVEINERRPLRSVDQALATFRAGKPILIHDFDDREDETDIVYPASDVTDSDVARLRNDAGGLVCVALSDEVAGALDLPFMQDIIDHPTSRDHDLGYDERSSFSITINHRDTYTGITDEDRARTISALAAMTDRPAPVEFAREFRSPGHVHILRGAPELLTNRQGHTELGLTLAKAAKIPPAVVVCEMLNDETGRSLSEHDAAAYARDHGLAFIHGDDIVQSFG